MIAAIVVYILCALTSIGCATLLLRNHRRTRAPLLLWSGLCFAFLALSNTILFFDGIVVPSVDLSFYRTAATLMGVAMLLYGLIWEAS
jgi:hypothetical protein